ncbi:hypothetical protein CLV46_0810 [Diaminobutyricimonas aerilata]|uniref:SAF domain-containing protein n=1 Tax=Diaminobutyricimonas aerilata TaxID=1162967 RepID=A0A2M9CHA3_9MICO|nr:hypothetical protein [Diaminobutyricimonas aerilata]PJJ71268.1 hypothetical protein CLV46_0810 [Diaminobutyricimonas aerilata]
MTAPSGEPARAPRRRLSVDPRLLIGLALVAVSVAGVVALLGAADTSVPVYAAREALAPGDEIDAGDLVAVEARIDDAESHYLLASALPSSGAVVTRAVGAGELVPLSAVGRADSGRLAAVVLPLGGALAEGVREGRAVDVWVARESEDGRVEAPSVLVSGATVARIVETDGLVVDDEAVQVEVLVPTGRLARVIEAVAAGDVLSLVPVGLELGE